MIEIQAETEAIRARTKAMQEKRLEANFNACRKETVACQETTEANPEEKASTSKEMESEVEEHEVPMESAVVKPVGGRKKQQRGQNLAAGRCGKPRKLTRGDCGPRGMLVATCRNVSRRAAVAWRKEASSGKIGSGSKLHELCFQVSSHLLQLHSAPVSSMLIFF
jgi:hypothetical protein